MIDTPGRVVGMYSRSPSQSGGMNSEPSRETGTAVAPNATTVTATTAQRQASTRRRTGRYSAMSSRVIGLARAGRMRPRIQ